MIIYSFISLNICFVAGHSDGSFEYPQQLFWLRNSKIDFQLCTYLEARARGHKTFFMRNLTEHEIYPAHKS